jgi:hypothetical protein
MGSNFEIQIPNNYHKSSLFMLSHARMWRRFALRVLGFQDLPFGWKHTKGEQFLLKKGDV